MPNDPAARTEQQPIADHRNIASDAASENLMNAGFMIGHDRRPFGLRVSNIQNCDRRAVRYQQQLSIPTIKT